MRLFNKRALLGLGIVCHMGVAVYACDADEVAEIALGAPQAEKSWNFATSDPEKYEIIFPARFLPGEITSLLSQTTRLETLRIMPKDYMGVPISATSLPFHFPQQEAIVSGLRGNTTLRHLDIFKLGEGFVSAFLPCVQGATALEALSLFKCQLSALDLSALGTFLTHHTHLRSLIFEEDAAKHNPDMDPQVCKIVSTLGKLPLDYLDFRYASREVEGTFLRTVPQLTSLMRLHLRCSEPQGDLHALDVFLQSPFLIRLALYTGESAYDIPVTPSAMALLGANTMLGDLYLERFSLTEESKVALSQALRVNTTLRDLISRQTFQVDEEAVAQNGTIQTIHPTQYSLVIDGAVKRNLHNNGMRDLRLSTLMLTVLATPVAAA